MLNNLPVLEVTTPDVLEITTTLEEFPLDNYRVNSDILTSVVEKELLQNPALLGVFVVEHYQVIGVISRHKFFEQLSKQYSRDIYSLRPIKIMLKIMLEKSENQLLRITISTTIIEAVKLALARSSNQCFYEPIVIVKNSQELGMLELSSLIIAQSKMFASINNKLTEQEKELRNYAEKIEQEKQKVNQYAEKLEIQQFELKQRHGHLEIQANKLKNRTEELSAQTTYMGNINQQFTNVSVGLSKEGKKTFSALNKSINSLTLSNQKIKDIGNIFLNKLLLIDRATNVITKIGKRIENLSFQTSLMTIHFAADREKEKHFATISEEIKQMSILNSEANTTINNIAKELKPQIKSLVNTSSENQEAISHLLLDSEKIKSILDKLSDLVEQKEENHLPETREVFKSQKSKV